MSKSALLKTVLLVGCCTGCQPIARAPAAPITAEPTAAAVPTATDRPRPTAGPETASPATAAPRPITVDSVEAVELVATLVGHSDRVYGLDFSADGRLLASGSWDDTIRIWDVASGEELRAVEAEGDWDVFFAPDDEHVASTEGLICDIASGDQVQSLEVIGGHATFSPDGCWMASAGFNAPILVWNVGTGETVQTLEGHTDRVFGMAFSPDGRLLATGSGMGPSDVSDFTVKIWDLETGQKLRSLKGHGGDVHAVTFSPDGALVASASIDYTVKVWDVKRGELVHTLWHQDGLWDVDFSPDGALLASGGVARKVRLWDVATGEELPVLRHDDELLAVAFSPSGALLATAGYDSRVYVWGVP